MGRDVIPYEPYHPHIVYTLVMTYLAWIGVAWYSRLMPRHLSKQRVALWTGAIMLPLYAEVTAYLIHLLRPAPETPVGYVLTHIHAFVIQRMPIDTFLSPPAQLALLAGAAALLMISLLRFAYGAISLQRALAGATPLHATNYAAMAAQFEALLAADRSRPPPTLLIRLPAPLAFVSGILRPRIYLTDTLLDLLAPDEALAVMCHEWAHIARRDMLWNGFVRLTRDLLWFLPGTRRVWCSLLASQDEACDALAARLTNQPLALAHALIKIARAWGQQPRQPLRLLTALPFVLANDALQARVMQMIRLSEGDAHRSWRSVASGYALLAAMLILPILPALLGS